MDSASGQGSDIDVDDAPILNQRNAFQKLSCDQCRARKVRCDREEPCANCVRKQFRCTYPAGFKSRPKKQRVAASNELDSKLDAIAEKLDQIYLTVGHSEASPLQFTQAYSPNQSSLAAAHSTPNSSKALGAADDTPSSDVDDEINLSTQAEFATDFAQKALDARYPSQLLPEVRSGLDALRNVLIDPSNQRTKTNNNSESFAILQVINKNGLNLPPVQSSMAAIQMLRESRKLRLLWQPEHLGINQFVEYFMVVYSSKPSPADIIIVTCGLYTLFDECARFETNDTTKQQFKSQGEMCQQSLETVLSALPFNLPNTIDYVLALYMVALYHLSRSQISKSYTYLVACAQMSLTLNFHHPPSTYRRHNITSNIPSNEQNIRQNRLFWSIYMLDKQLSLRLNRSSIIRDADISITFDSLSMRNSMDECHFLIPKWVRLCSMLGKVYEDLYSPGALRQANDAREARARELAEELKHCYDTPDREETMVLRDVLNEFGQPLYGIFMRADKISLLAVLTLIYRSIKPSPAPGTSAVTSAFCAECLACAKECLEEHRNCLVLLQGAESTFLEVYIQWALLSAPMVPYIVLFCHTIETNDPQHLENLSTLIETIKILPPDMSKVYAKQLLIFELMYNVAYKYVNLGPSNDQTQAFPLGTTCTPFDMFFNEAGMNMPSTAVAQQAGGISQFQDQSGQAMNFQFDAESSAGAGFTGDEYRMDHSAALGNWFDQNYEVFKMLDDDIH